MLAADRHGGRTSFVSLLRVGRVARTETIRGATQRELRLLEHLLEASLAEEDQTDLAAATAEHRAGGPARAGDPRSPLSRVSAAEERTPSSTARTCVADRVVGGDHRRVELRARAAADLRARRREPTASR